ncbi:MAG: response regulator transcription factor [Sulfurimonas sp.]|nr:response regulator transcription factor [Sulfurimonas sp.]
MINSTDITKYTRDLSILFVEDHKELRVDTIDILKNFFKTVDSSENGKEALDKYIKYKEQNSQYYDLVLSDIRMPIMDGIELTEKIYDLNPSQIIIILSAHDETKYLLKLVNLGIEQFIKKPIDYQELLSAFLNSAKKLKEKNNLDTNTKIIQISKKITYNKDSKSLYNGKENIYLTKFEIIFIELLTTNIGKIYSNDEIVLHYNSLKENIDSTNIRKLVSKLRKKLPTNNLESIYGIGYKFIPYL